MTGCKPKGGQNDRQLQPDLGLIAVADLSDESLSEIESPSARRLDHGRLV